MTALDIRPAAGSRAAYTSFVDGARTGRSGTEIPLLDPATGRQWASAFVDAGLVEPAVASAHKGFGEWSMLSAGERGVLLRRLGDRIVAAAEELGPLESLANGKPVAATIAEVRAAGQWYHFYAHVAEAQDGHHRELSRTAEALVRREPLGVVVAITPFNAALSLGSWKLAPALAAGNTVIVKPPADAPASTIRLAELAIEAGIPRGVINVVIGDGPCGESLATHPRVAMVSFTGSSATARRLGAQVLGQMKRYVCEAGGKSAHIVFEDADVDGAVVAATQGAFSAAGQTCVAGSRLLVHVSVQDHFLDKYTAAIARLRLGDPKSPQTHIGPVASKRQLDRIETFVADAVRQGARIAAGGRKLDMPGELAGGYWFAPTVLTDVDDSMAVCREEVFGPVVVLRPFATEEEAIEIANSVDYGLAAGFWTRDLARARRVSRRLQAGTVWINTYRLIHLRAPFGGYKQSGLGRENGVEALDEFSQIKSIVTDYAPPVNPFAS